MFNIERAIEFIKSSLKITSLQIGGITLIIEKEVVKKKVKIVSK